MKPIDFDVKCSYCGDKMEPSPIYRKKVVPEGTKDLGIKEEIATFKCPSCDQIKDDELQKCECGRLVDRKLKMRVYDMSSGESKQDRIQHFVFGCPFCIDCKSCGSKIMFGKTYGDSVYKRKDYINVSADHFYFHEACYIEAEQQKEAEQATIHADRSKGTKVTQSLETVVDFDSSTNGKIQAKRIQNKNLSTLKDLIKSKNNQFQRSEPDFTTDRDFYRYSGGCLIIFPIIISIVTLLLETILRFFNITALNGLGVGITSLSFLLVIFGVFLWIRSFFMKE